MRFFLVPASEAAGKNLPFLLLPPPLCNHCLHCLLLNHLLSCTNFMLDSHKIIQLNYCCEIRKVQIHFYLEMQSRPFLPGNNGAIWPTSLFDLKHSFLANKTGYLSMNFLTKAWTDSCPLRH